jgi:alpha-tubulin suppressor-like RCC1 family protein/tRNA A-37 threonylcarbamoyl transferase component Bud32
MTSEHSPVTHAALDADYEIIRELGRGGTALVYLARERATGDEVAIKVIRSRYIDDDEAQARFAREARLVAQLHHPNIVPVRAVLDLDTAGLAIVMAHVVGHTLKQRIKQEGWLAPETAAQILREIGGALDVAHANGIVHRDVKPENIFIDAHGRAMLADFGLARSMTPDSALTMAGVALGTPAYMAPEQIDGTDLDARVDVYSLGLVAWEMLTGRRAWLGEGLYAILYHQKHELPPDVRELREDVPDRLAEVIARAIEKRRDARWGSVREMLDALDESTPLVLAPHRVSHGDETIRFVLPPLPTTEPAPVYALEQFTEEVPLIEVRRRRLPVVARTATVVATLSFAAIAAALVVRSRADVAPLALASDTILPVLQGDVPKRVILPAPIDTQVVRHETTRALVVAPPPTAKPATPMTAAVDSTPLPPVPIPALNARPRIANISVASEKIAPADPSANSVWRGPPALKPTASIVAGGTHSCSVSAAGKALCWGNNDHGQLGDTSSERAKAVIGVDVQLHLVAITAGTSHTCAIARDGAALCWGNNDHGQSGVRSFASKVAPSIVRDSHVFWAIAAGDEHTCAVDEYGVPWCWGLNARGQLGEPSINESSAPVLAGNGAIHFISITAGSSFTCGLSANGRVSCWGENGAGQLGDGSNFDRPLPVAVASGAFASIAAGSNHVCGLTVEGEAYCWGRNAFGQLGDGGTFDRNTPVRVRGGTRFTSITAGANHTCGVAVDGTGYCWGQNTYGQLGTGGATDVAQPATVADGHTFASLRASASHTCGLTVGGEAFCWGNNAQNQLGDGTQAHRARPTLVAGMRDR